MQQRSTAPFGSGADTEPPLWTILGQVTLGKNKHLSYFHENIHFYTFLSFSLSFTLLKISKPCLQQFCILVSSFDPCSTAPFWHVVKMLHPLFQGQLHNWFIMHPVSCTILYAAPHACNSQSTFFNLFFSFFLLCSWTWSQNLHQAIRNEPYLCFIETNDFETFRGCAYVTSFHTVFFTLYIGPLLCSTNIVPSI